MARQLPRFQSQAQRAADARKLEKLLLEVGPLEPGTLGGATAGSDKLRGIPAIGRGCPGRIAGTDPVAETIRRSERRRRR